MASGYTKGEPRGSSGGARAITCLVTYDVAPGQEDRFRVYARRWMYVITRLGGEHHGCFVQPDDRTVEDLKDVPLSYPWAGQHDASQVAIALFSFPDVASYRAYRARAEADAQVLALNREYEASPCFTAYRRTFLSRMDVDLLRL